MAVCRDHFLVPNLHHHRAAFLARQEDVSLGLYACLQVSWTQWTPWDKIRWCFLRCDSHLLPVPVPTSYSGSHCTTPALRDFLSWGSTLLRRGRTSLSCSKGHLSLVPCLLGIFSPVLESFHGSISLLICLAWSFQWGFASSPENSRAAWKSYSPESNLHLSWVESHPPSFLPQPGIYSPPSHVSHQSRSPLAHPLGSPTFGWWEVLALSSFVAKIKISITDVTIFKGQHWSIMLFGY